MRRLAPIADCLTNLVPSVNKDRDLPVPMVVQKLAEEDSNQHRRVEVGRIQVPKTASIQTRLDIIHKLEIEEQPSSA